MYFALMGGVPNQLLPDKSDSAAIDWTKILGKDPAHYDETGIDPHMIPSTTARPGLPPETASDEADPIHGREWATQGSDLQYACTFDLYERIDGGPPVPTRRTCKDSRTCDCDGKSKPPLCAKDDPSVQIKGKAYPTRRELMLARELGDHAIVASLCPRQLATPEADDYGYRPAVRAITDRLEASIVDACLPRPLERESPGGPVPCLVLATLPDPGPDTICTQLGMTIPSAEVSARFRDRRAADEGEASRRLPVCQLEQIQVPEGESCRDEDHTVGFCYAEHVPRSRCAQSLAFTKPTAALIETRFSLQCIQLQ